MSEAKRQLEAALAQRLERLEHEVARRATDWLEVFAAPSSYPELRRNFLDRALGEVWRREQLRALSADVRQMGDDVDVRARAVYFLALDSCDPRLVPSFREWLAARMGREAAEAQAPGGIPQNA